MEIIKLIKADLIGSTVKCDEKLEDVLNEQMEDIENEELEHLAYLFQFAPRAGFNESCVLNVLKRWVALKIKKGEKHCELKAGKFYICHTNFHHIIPKENERFIELNSRIGDVFQCVRDGYACGVYLGDYDEFGELGEWFQELHIQSDDLIPDSPKTAPNPYSGTTFEHNGHTYGMCAKDNGVEIMVDGKTKASVFAD